MWKSRQNEIALVTLLALTTDARPVNWSTSCRKTDKRFRNNSSKWMKNTRGIKTRIAVWVTAPWQKRSFGKIHLLVSLFVGLAVYGAHLWSASRTIWIIPLPLGVAPKLLNCAVLIFFVVSQVLGKDQDDGKRVFQVRRIWTHFTWLWRRRRRWSIWRKWRWIWNGSTPDIFHAGRREVWQRIGQSPT